jgi:hypothetical protein
VVQDVGQVQVPVLARKKKKGSGDATSWVGHLGFRQLFPEPPPPIICAPCVLGAGAGGRKGRKDQQTLIIKGTNWKPSGYIHPHKI